jgi:hypothetical protein
VKGSRCVCRRLLSIVVMRAVAFRGAPRAEHWLRRCLLPRQQLHQQVLLAHDVRRRRRLGGVGAVTDRRVHGRLRPGGVLGC